MPYCPSSHQVFSFFTLPRAARTNSRNLGYCFACFRNRPLLERFLARMDNKILNSSNMRPLKIGFARARTMPDLVSNFRNELREASVANTFWYCFVASTCGDK